MLRLNPVTRAAVYASTQTVHDPARQTVTLRQIWRGCSFGI